MSQQQFPCTNCGANVEFAPGTTLLRCPYCQHETPLLPSGAAVREYSYEAFAGVHRKPVSAMSATVFVCRGCGAQTQSDAIAEECQFCGQPLVADVTASEQVAPEAVLPFVVDRPALQNALRSWVSSRWFAPSGLKKVAEAESSRSTYLPHWTFDARTHSKYDGERGEHYWDTETYTETVDGKTRTATRQVQKTRWYSTSGEVQRDFDDVLVVGTTRVSAGHLDALEPWPLPAAQPYRAEYLAGHQALRYDIEPEAALETAKSRMATVITDDCESDIGGDEQRVQSVDTDYDDLAFKLMLLPVWIACYLHGGKTYNVLVNGQTGEVAGERPYSPAKIALLVLAVVALIALVVLLVLLA